jgi:glutamate/tyrosine decarboxylase-like PLP-dependent enzyme
MSLNLAKRAVRKPAEDETGDVLRVAHVRALAFRDSLGARAPRPTISAAEMLQRFDGPLPEFGESGASVIDALAEAADPGLMAMPGSRFFGWIIGASHPVGVAADWLTSAWGQNAGNYTAAPAAAMAEKAAGAWLLELFDLPRDSSIGFVTGATMANFTCLAAARSAQYAKHGWDVEADGLIGGPRLHVFVGDEAHATVFSALRYLGLGADRAHRVASDSEGRMEPRALEEAIAQVEGPKIVIAQAGQMNTGAFDPLAQVSDIAQAHGAWLHVDGAFGLWARAVAELAPSLAGAERADSWAVDGHKWLQLPYDSGFAVVRDAAAHRRAMGVSTSYLPEAQALEHDPSHYAPELSRRARGFAAWAMLRTLGREGVAAMVRRHCALARRLADSLRSVPGLEILNEVGLNQVVVGFGAGEAPAMQDALAHAAVEDLQRENIVFAGGVLWKGRWALRIPIIAWPLQEEDIDRLADAIARAFRNAASRLAEHERVAQ